MVALIVVEISDLIFAVDSIPAIFVVTQDPFIIYTSNVFAILGLRSLYFALAAVIDKFHYLKFALALILTFIGVKMLGKEFVHDLPVWVTLGIVAGTLLGAVVASIIWPPRHKATEQLEEALAETNKEGSHP
jgi:tellurite resistance protein TerC